MDGVVDGIADVGAVEGNLGDGGACEGVVQRVRHLRNRSCCWEVNSSESGDEGFGADR